jgi:hypothetical protein
MTRAHTAVDDRVGDRDGGEPAELHRAAQESVVHVADGTDDGHRRQQPDGRRCLRLTERVGERLGHDEGEGRQGGAEDEVEPEDRADERLVDDVTLDDHRCRSEVGELPGRHHDHHGGSGDTELFGRQEARQDHAHGQA